VALAFDFVFTILVLVIAKRFPSPPARQSKGRFEVAREVKLYIRSILMSG